MLLNYTLKITNVHAVIPTKSLILIWEIPRNTSYQEVQKKQVFGSLNITEEKKGIIVIFYKFLVKFFELVVTPTFPVTKQEFDKSNSEIPNDFVQDDSFVEVVEEQEKV